MNIHSHNIRRHFLASISKNNLVTRVLAPLLSEKENHKMVTINETDISEEPGEEEIIKTIYRSVREGKLASVISINYTAGG